MTEAEALDDWCDRIIALIAQSNRLRTDREAFAREFAELIEAGDDLAECFSAPEPDEDLEP